MCGIAGYISNRVDGDLLTSLRNMAAEISHRGPDDEGFFEAVTRDSRQRIGLAHRRLSIIDLSTGHQPMGNEDGSVQVVFNGEIYNFQSLRDQLIACGHRFSTHSDTETIVHAYEEWGDACVERFRGMFAFALWDARQERLLLARDRFGKKPLFICRRNGSLLFASEIKAILAFPGITASVNHAALWDYVAYRYVPAPDTLFAGVEKLMPGSVGVWQAGRFVEKRYYIPPDRDSRQEIPDPEDVVDRFVDKLDESVRIRMMSDVPLGVFLSGGIDSSMIVALMARQSDQPVKTFSVGFAESGYSELRYARHVADRFGTDHHELTISQTHLMDYLEPLVRFRDAPVAEPSDIPIYLLSRLARRTVKVVLTGEGSDEILGGYPKHVYERYAALYQRVPRGIRHQLLEPMVRTLPYSFRRTKTAISSMGISDYRERMIRWFGTLTSVEQRELLSPEIDRNPKRGSVEFDAAATASALRRILYFDQASWLPDNLLERGDRMTMAASIEARMPFLDHELAAFVSGLGDGWRVQGRTTKRILRVAAARFMPAEMFGRSKIGFRVPVSEWFRGPMRNYMLEHLTGTESRTRRYYQTPVLQRLINEHVSGKQNHEKLLWCLVSLEVWHRVYGLTA